MGKWEVEVEQYTYEAGMERLGWKNEAEAKAEKGGVVREESFFFCELFQRCILPYFINIKPKKVWRFAP